MNKFSSYFCAVNRGSKPLRIASNACHEGFQLSLSKCNTEWVLLPSPEGKTWDNDYRKMPSNVIEVSQEQFNNIDYIDLTMSHTIAQRSEMQNISDFFSIKHINLNHIYPNPEINERCLRELKKQNERAISVFTTKHQAEEWGYSENECKIINHGIDCSHFNGWNPKNSKILTVGNYYKERGSELGYDLYDLVKRKIGAQSFLHVGKSTDGSSMVAKDYSELAEIYRTSFVFLNTCHRSVLPTVLLEAMATGMPVITKENPTIKQIINHGENGFIANTADEICDYLISLDKDIELARKIGQGARKTVLEKYNMDKFISEWEALFKENIIK